MRLAPAGRRRLTCLFLLAVFLGAGTSLPGPDALLHHWEKAGAEQSQIHVESAGGCASHVESCSLGRAATGAGAALAAGLVVRLNGALSAGAPVIPARSVPSSSPATLPQPRAPPVPVA